jgi:uncharacterized protein YqeY
MSATAPTLKQRVEEDMKAALRSGDKRRLGAVRLILAALKQREIDERITLDDAQALAVLDKMVKQRRDSVAQYQSANRPDLAEQESFEIEVIQSYLPAALSEQELDAAIEAAIAATGAASIKDLGKVMGVLKPQLAGRADMGAVSTKLKARLG